MADFLYSQKLLKPETDYFIGRYFNHRNTFPGADITTTYIYFDKYGFLWSGTYNGLYCYDGIEYTGYPSGSTGNSGLAGNQVSCIIEDSDGILWVSTFGALNRFNRNTNSFTHFFPDTANLINPSNRIHSMTTDNKGNIWLLTGGDLFRFTPRNESFRRFQLDSLSYRTEMAAVSGSGRIAEDIKGRIWIATLYGLYMYDPGLEEFKHFMNIPGDKNSIPGNEILFVCPDRSGNIWCSVAGKGLVKINEGKDLQFSSVAPFIKENPVSSLDTLTTLLPDSKGRVWAFGKGFFLRYDSTNDSSISYLLPKPKYLNPKHYFNHLDLRFAFEDLNGCIWFLHALEGYLFRFEPEGEKLKMTFVPNWSIFHAVLDSRGNFWFACGANNIWNLVLNGVPFTGQLIPNRFNVSGISASLVAENTEYLWLVLSDGVFRSRKDLSGSSLKPEPFLFRDGGTYASAVRKDKSGFLWFGRDGGKITRLGKKPEEVKDFYLPDKHTCPVTDFLEDRNGNMWIISPYVIFLKPHGSERIEVFKKGNRELEKAMGGGIYNVLLDSSDNLWFATFGNGVYCFNTGSGKTVFQGKSEGLDIPFGDYCMKMAEDSRGRIWTLWYRNGLRLYDPSSGIFTETDIAKGEGLINYMDVYIDENDRMMVAHTGGFSFCDIQADSAWNISHNLSAGGCFTYKTSTGQLLFISGQQLLCFRKKNNINTAVPPLAFSSILVNGQEYKRLHPDEYDLNSTKSIKLKHSENNLQISFSSLDLTEPKLNHYKYFMKGIDRDTIYVKYDGRIAVYRKMRPGRYKFWFTGSNNHDIWNSPGKSVDIIISPPWYTSKLSFIIYLLFFTGTLFGLYRWRIRNMRVEKEALEKHIRERTAELELKNRLISEMDNLKTKFFSEISHEIRTPLSLIVGPVDTLLRENKGKIDESSYSWMKMIQRNANRLLALVNQLLDIAKLDSGRMKLNLLNDDINKCLRLTAFGFLSLAETRKITFRVNIPSNKCITCFDRDKIEKILSNLLVNAFKFTPSGGTVILTAEVDQKEVPGQAFLHLSVSDTGVGIDAADLPKIFERFYSSEGQWEKDGKGTGIGLSLVNEFVGMMNGKINVSSESGKGFLFSISIPMPLPVQEDIEDYPEYQPEAELHIGKNTLFPIYESDIKITPSDNGKPHLLVVEDNDDLRYYIMENMLSDYVVTECNNGNEGLRMAISGIPDIVLSDIILPGLGGTELCQKLKNDERTSHIIVLLLTAKTSQTDKIEGLESGADDYIFKPFDLTELRTRMSNLLKQRERLRNKYGLLTGFETTGAKIETADDKFMSKITAIIRSRIHDFEFDVGALQEEIGMSRVHLYRKLKAITGLAPHELIKNYRMKEAARLIGIKAGNIAEIAISVGFSNPSYFSTTFREYYGISPKDYKAPGK